MTRRSYNKTYNERPFFDKDIIEDSIQKARQTKMLNTHKSRRNRIKRKNISNRMNTVYRPLLPIKKPKVFLSHNWIDLKTGTNNHQKIKKINEMILKTNLIDTWFDENDMKDHIVKSMCDGIDNSDLVIIFITRSYIDKCNKVENDNCKIEFDYAIKRKGLQKNIPVVIDEDCLDTQLGMD